MTSGARGLGEALWDQVTRWPLPEDTVLSWRSRVWPCAEDSEAHFGCYRDFVFLHQCHVETKLWVSRRLSPAPTVSGPLFETAREIP